MGLLEKQFDIWKLERMWKMGEPEEVKLPEPRFPVGRCKKCGMEFTDKAHTELANGQNIVYCSYECYCND